MNLHDFGEALYGTTPPPTADQYAAARAYVARWGDRPPFGCALLTWEDS